MWTAVSFVVISLFIDQFQGIEVAAAGSEWNVVRVDVLSELADWPKSYLIDDDVNTRWSSERNENVEPDEWVAFWFDTYHETNYIKIYPRYSQNSALAFPVEFTIYYSDGVQWNPIYTVEHFPNPHEDWIILPLGQTVTANGLRIVATELGTDDSGKHYFQLGEVSGGYDPGFETLQLVGFDADVGINQFDNVGAGQFDPNKISHWNYDYRNFLNDGERLQESTCAEKKNIYSHQAQWVESEQQWYIYYGGQDSPTGYACDPSHDRIYMTTTDKDFQTIDMVGRRVIVDEGAFHHVNNPAVTQTSEGTFAMVYTAAYDLYGDADQNKPAYATSTDGKNWSPSNPGDPFGSNALIDMNNYHANWDDIYINNSNGLLYDRGQFWYYFGPVAQIDLSDYRGYSDDMIHFTEAGDIFATPNYATNKAMNDIKKFRWNGSDYYIFVAHQNEEAVYYSLSSDPNNFPDMQTLFYNTNYAEPDDASLDDCIVSAGIVADETILYGVLYAASNANGLECHPPEGEEAPTKNTNVLYANWLQKKVYFSNEDVGWGDIERADGPRTVRLSLINDQSIETGIISIYDTDGTTVLFTSPEVTIVSGMHWKYNTSTGCVPPTVGDWTITVDCSLSGIVTAPRDVIVENNAQLTIEDGAAIDIDFAYYGLNIKQGSGVLLKNNAKIH